MNLGSFFCNLISSFAFAAITICFAYLLTFFTLRSKRVKRLRVLKINKHSADVELSIYVAHLVIAEGQVNLINGEPSKHFKGAGVPIMEVEAAYKVANKLSLGLIEPLPDSLRQFLMKNTSGYNRVKVTVTPSPLNLDGKHEHKRIVLIGGPEFNFLTHHYLSLSKIYTCKEIEECDDPVFERETSDLVVETIKPKAKDRNLGLVQRITLESGQVIVFLIGRGTNGTLAAVEYFVNNWEKLDDTYGEQDFGIVLECPKRGNDPKGFEKAVVRDKFPF